MRVLIDECIDEPLRNSLHLITIAKQPGTLDCLDWKMASLLQRRRQPTSTFSLPWIKVSGTNKT